MKCINCNNEIEDTANFCKYCGNKVMKVDETDSEENKTDSEENVDTDKETENRDDDKEENTEKDNGEEISASVTAEVFEVPKDKTLNKSKIKTISIISVLIVILCAATLYGYNKYINAVLSVPVNNRDYKIISNEKLAFNYVGDLTKGELYIVSDGNGVKIADNVLVNTYHINPNREFVYYTALAEDGSNKNYIYKDGKSETFEGSFYRFTEDGKYMLYTADSKVYMYDCENNISKEIAQTDNDSKLWKYQYDDKNNIVYICLGENNSLYKSSFVENEDSENIASSIEKFNVFGLNAYGYKKSSSSKYEIKTENSEDIISVDFTDVNDIQSSQDGSTVLFTGTKDEEINKEYALYVMVEGFDEPIRLLSGAVNKFVYKEEINKVFVFKDDSLYSIDLVPRTRKNIKNSEEYYNGLNECEAVKLESEIQDFNVSPDGKNIIAVKNPNAVEETTVKSEESTAKTENETKTNNTEDGLSKAFLSVVYAEETETESLTSEVITEQNSSTEVNNETTTQSASTVTETQTETTTEERVVGATVELVIIRGEEKKIVDVADSAAICAQYLSLSNTSIVYPLAVNGKVELHIINNIDDGLDSIEKNDEIICKNTGLFKFDNIFNELCYYDKDNKSVVNYANNKKLNAEKTIDYDLIYIDAGKGFDNYNLAYKKIPDYNTFVGKFKMKGNDKALDDIIIEFTKDKEVKVYSIGEAHGNTKFKVNENTSNRTALTIAPEGGVKFEPTCKVYYNHENYKSSLLARTLMTNSSLLISDFDGILKYRIDSNETVVLEKLSDENFNTAISEQKSKHSQNVKKLEEEQKAVVRAAVVEALKEFRRESLEETARDYYYNDVWVSPYETLYSWHGYAYETSDTYKNYHYAYVYSYYIDYDNGDIWLETMSSNGKTLWVVR